MGAAEVAEAADVLKPEKLLRDHSSINVRKWQFMMIYSTVNHQRGGWASQIREQMSGPDLHVFTLKFHSNFSPKKTRFFHFLGAKKKKKKKKKKGIMQLFS